MTQELPDGYVEDMRLLNAAGAAWFRAHPFAEPRFRINEFEAAVKRQAGRGQHEKVAIAGTLDQVIDLIAANEDARAFLHAINEAVGRRATYMQFLAIYEMQLEEHIRRSQTQLEGDGWKCPTCGARCDAATALDGKPRKPTVGAIGVCGSCAGLQVCNDAEDGWAVMSEAVLRALPKAQRKALCDVRNRIRERLAEKKRSS